MAQGPAATGRAPDRVQLLLLELRLLHVLELAVYLPGGVARLLVARKWLAVRLAVRSRRHHVRSRWARLRCPVPTHWRAMGMRNSRDARADSRRRVPARGRVRNQSLRGSRHAVAVLWLHPLHRRAVLGRVNVRGRPAYSGCNRSDEYGRKHSWPARACHRVDDRSPGLVADARQRFDICISRRHFVAVHWRTKRSSAWFFA